jgi:HD-GYP domain-containing protein (c-di-GMP phosphodiesterase class II)
MKRHASYSAELLKQTRGISQVALLAAAQHHERYDGSGYPHGLKGGEISLHGQMIAIADVYDAITSLRVYHNGMPPTEALRKMYEWSKSHFAPELVQSFIKGIGIYPAGSLVRMESGIMGIVREIAQDNLLKPVVKTFYHAEKRCYLAPAIVDLATVPDKIVAHESFEKWGIDQARWL